MLVPRMFILFINIWVNIITAEAAFPSKDLLRKSYGKRPTLDWRAYLEKNLLDEMEAQLNGQSTSVCKSIKCKIIL